MISYTPSPRRAAALQAACDNHNTNNGTSLTVDAYFTLLADAELDGKAAVLRVGLIPPVEFQERFQRLGVYASIFERAKTDTTLAAYLAKLRAKTDDVNLFSSDVKNGLAYLVSVKELTQPQADAIGAVTWNPPPPLAPPVV